MKIISNDNKTIVINPEVIYVKRVAQYSSDDLVYGIVAEKGTYSCTMSRYETEDEAVEVLRNIYKYNNCDLSSKNETW